MVEEQEGVEEGRRKQSATVRRRSEEVGNTKVQLQHVCQMRAGSNDAGLLDDARGGARRGHRRGARARTMRGGAWHAHRHRGWSHGAKDTEGKGIGKHVAEQRAGEREKAQGTKAAVRALGVRMKDATVCGV